MAFNFSEAKSKINLVELILQEGFTLDPEESSKEDYLSAKATDRHSYAWILRRGNPDGSRKSSEKIGVSLLYDAHSQSQRWLYTDNRSTKKHGSGSIIDWMLAHVEDVKTAGEALRYVNQRLEKRNGSNCGAIDATSEAKTKKIVKIREHVEKNTFHTTSNKYLIDKRSIKKSVLEDQRFVKTIRQDKKGNAIFMHQDRTGITGYSAKNENYSSFSAGGKRSLWRSNCFTSDAVLVITESAIDALSYFQIKQMNGQDTSNTRFLATDGRLSKPQLELLLAAIAKVPKTILAFDDDEAGNNYVQKVYDACSKEMMTRISRETPPFGCKDWNEVFG